MAAAEHLLGEALDEQRHAQNRRAGAIALLTAIVPGLGVVAALLESAGFPRPFGALLLFIGLIAIGLLARVLLRWPSETDSSRLLVALQLASMVGDVYLETARREGWSYLRVEATRLRLSAFPLDPQRAATPRSREGSVERW